MLARVHTWSAGVEVWACVGVFVRSVMGWILVDGGNILRVLLNSHAVYESSDGWVKHYDYLIYLLVCKLLFI